MALKVFGDAKVLKKRDIAAAERRYREVQDQNDKLVANASLEVEAAHAESRRALKELVKSQRAAKDIAKAYNVLNFPRALRAFDNSSLPSDIGPAAPTQEPMPKPEPTPTPEPAPEPTLEPTPKPEPAPEPKPEPTP